MKLWEMIRDGEVGDRFKCEMSGVVYEMNENDGGRFIKKEKPAADDFYDYFLSLSAVTMNSEWIKLPKPVAYVTFHEAYKAFFNGRIIEAKTSGRKYDPALHNAILPEDVDDQWTIQ